MTGELKRSLAAVILFPLKLGDRGHDGHESEFYLIFFRGPNTLLKSALLNNNNNNNNNNNIIQKNTDHVQSHIVLPIIGMLMHMR